MSIRTFELLGRRLKALRRQRGFTQARLSEAAGVSYKYYQEIEGGRRDDLKLSTIIRLALALNVELRSVFDFDTTDFGSDALHAAENRRRAKA